MMADHPAAGALAARWRPPEKSQQELIVRKLVLFLRELNHLLREDGGPQGQLWKAVAELFLEDPALVAKLDPDPPAATLETLIEVEGIIDDACMAIPGKVLRICQLLSSQPVCN
ncbi:MAG: hypothetical protein GY856_28255 [bacterium]|nr:hypothetical protein [bacterium]